MIDDDTGGLLFDCLRFDVNPAKLNFFAKPSFKKKKKKKFVTGIAKDKVLENLLNMSDSDQEGKDEDGNVLDKD